MNTNDQERLAQLKQILEEMTTLLRQAGWIGNGATLEESIQLGRRAQERNKKALHALAAELKDEHLDEKLKEIETIERTLQAVEDIGRRAEAVMANALASVAEPAMEVYHAAKRLSREPGSELEGHVRAMHRALRAAERKGKTSRRR